MAQVLATTDLPPSHFDLLEAAGVAVLGTIGAGNRPQLTAVWYLFDDDGRLKLTIRTERQKLKNLRERPVATLFFVDPDRPLRTLEVRANVEIEPDDDYAFANRIGKKYGADLRSFDQPGDRRVVVTLHPIRVNRRE